MMQQQKCLMKGGKDIKSLVIILEKNMFSVKEQCKIVWLGKHKMNTDSKYSFGLYFTYFHFKVSGSTPLGVEVDFKI